MREYGLTVLVAAAVTYLLTPLVRRFAIAVGARHAARDRDVHIEPTPLLGGFAIYGGLVAGLVVASRLTHLGTVFAGTRVESGLLLAGGMVVLMGFVDDRWGMSAVSKLAGQVAAGVVLVWSGAVVTWLPLPSGGTLALTPDEATALTILVVVVTINAVNFIDGLDGLATGIVGIGAAAFFVYYYSLTKRLGLDNQTGPALASAVLAGVCLGFLPHNFYPARIFMGDTGAMLLGLLLAYAPISSLASLDPTTLTSRSAYSSGTVNRFPEILPLLLPAAILLIPYADLLLAVVRRTRAGLSPFSADKKHLHHRLLGIGHSHRASVMIMYLWAALFAGTVVLLSIMRTALLVLAIVTVAGVLVLLLASMRRLRRGSLQLVPTVLVRGNRAASVAAVPGASGQRANGPGASGPAANGPGAGRRAVADQGAGYGPGGYGPGHQPPGYGAGGQPPGYGPGHQPPGYGAGGQPPGYGAGGQEAGEYGLADRGAAALGWPAVAGPAVDDGWPTEPGPRRNGGGHDPEHGPGDPGRPATPQGQDPPALPRRSR